MAYHTNAHGENPAAGKGNTRVYKVMIIIFLAAITVFAALNYSSGDSMKYDKKLCPYLAQGNMSASLGIKYFETPYCVWCWIEKPALDRLAENKGSLLRLERYDMRYCRNEADKYGIVGVPSFVFITAEKTGAYYGYIPEKRLNEVVDGLLKV
jgi:thiol-disulfide isomerase/thioredoxin